jgi:hypothetical protein
MICRFGSDRLSCCPASDAHFIAHCSSLEQKQCRLLSATRKSRVRAVQRKSRMEENINNQFGLKPIQAYVMRNFVPHTILNGRTSHTAFNSLPMYGQEIYSPRDVASWPVSRQGFVVVLYAPPDDQGQAAGTLVALAFRFDQPTLIVAVLSNYRFDLGADRAALFFCHRNRIMLVGR